MRKATKGRWEGFHPATNALWMYYLADTLLNLKAFPLDPSQKKRLRDFRCGFYSYPISFSSSSAHMAEFTLLRCSARVCSHRLA